MSIAEQKEWTLILTEWREREVSKIPRLVIPENAFRKELHAFTDSSQRCYATTVYIKALNGTQWTCKLVFAKARLRLSAPRTLLL